MKSDIFYFNSLSVTTVCFTVVAMVMIAGNYHMAIL